MATEKQIQIEIASSKIAPDICELKINGSLDWSNFNVVEQEIEQIFKKGIYKLVVNLKGTEYISSAGFGCFITSLDTAIKNKGNIIFFGTPPQIKEIFEILGLSRVLQFCETLEDAIKTLRQESS